MSAGTGIVRRRFVLRRLVRRRIVRRRIVRMALAASVLAPGMLGAQAVGLESAPGAAGPQWLERWSPLRPVADLRRALPGTDIALPGVLVRPAPRVGLLWSAGNPAALPFEVEDTWAAFTGAIAGASGDYRRPLDPGEVEGSALAGSGWRPVGERGVVIGRASVERVTMSGGAHMNRVDPYTASPFSVADTSGADLGRTAARLEGAGGIRLGPIGLGLALAFAPAETRTVAAPVPKTNIAARPAVNAGLVWELGPALRVGAHGRWLRTTQSIQHLAVAAGSRIFEFAGYHEPIPLDLATFYTRRLEAEALGAGLSAGGEAFRARWVLHAEVGEVEEFQWDGSTDFESRDRWTARSREAGVALQRPLRYGSIALLLTGQARWSTLDGTATRADRPEPDDAFDAEAEAIGLEADVRVTHPAGWQAALTVGTTRSVQTRTDPIARVHSRVESWSPTVALEVARAVGSGLSLGVGAAAGQYAPAGALPHPDQMGDAYRAYIAPENMLYGTPANAYTAEATVRWGHASGSAVWLRPRYGSLGGGETGFVLPLSPEGDRTGWGVELGVSLPR